MFGSRRMKTISTATSSSNSYSPYSIIFSPNKCNVQNNNNNNNHHHNIRNMFIFVGSIILAATGIAAYFKSKKHFHLIATKIIYEIKYNVIGLKALIDDLVYSEGNKIELHEKSWKIAIVTGGSRGIGSEVVKMLLQCGMEVIVACRMPEAGERLIKSLRESGVTKGSAKVYELDNSSFRSVKSFAQAVKKDYDRIDILINNAGIMFPPYGETEDGFESQWGVNYLSHFLLTSLLVPLLKKSATEKESARIVNVSSCAHLVGDINFDDINHRNSFITSAAYAQSKLAQVMFTKSVQELMNKEGLNIQSYVVHPGLVNTDLFDGTPMKKHAKWFMDLMFKNPEQGATPIVYAAVSEEVEKSGGVYITNCRINSTKVNEDDYEIRKKLFNLSLEQTGLKSFL